LNTDLTTAISEAFNLSSSTVSLLSEPTDIPIFLRRSADGNIAKEYDTDKIAKAVSSFVKDYNSLVSSTADSSSRYVLNSASNMVNYTRANADLLKKIGYQL